MRITNIDIKNYRQYEQISFNFPKSSTNDIHIIVAQNGVGKTNLLNAVTWCLYGVEPHLSDDTQNLGLSKLNLRAISNAKANNMKSDYVEVSIRASDDKKTFIFSRKLPVRVDPIFEEKTNETFLISESTLEGDTKIYDDPDDTKRIVDKYMPEKIREYFYFDGEQLNNYFISTRKGRVRDAIFTISQVDLVRNAHTRLSKLIAEKRKEASNKAPNIGEINKELESMSQNLDDLETNKNQLEEQIEKSETIIKENTEFLQGEENISELELELQNLNKERKKYSEDLIEIQNDTFHFVRKMKTILNSYPAVKKAIDLIAEKEASNALPPDIDKALLIKALSNKRCVICNQPIDESNDYHIRELIESYQVSSATSHLLVELRGELENIIKDASDYPIEKERIIRKTKRIENNLDSIDKQIGEISNRVNRVGDKEEVKRRFVERKENEVLKVKNHERLGVVKDQIDSTKKKLDSKKIELTKALGRDDECKKIRQQIRFATLSMNIIKEIEEDMIDDVRIQMEKITTEYFKKLIWKMDTYDRIVLDDDFQLDLLHKDGYSCIGTCSAAERALLALSFTLALHRVSGFNSLLFIDTPVSRVSDTNRVNFAKVLSEVSESKQLIMTFTPSEYSDDIKSVFDPIARTNVTLGLSDNERITLIK